VGAAQRGDLKLISVVMNSSDIYSDTEKLLDYGFNNYEMVAVAEKDKVNGVNVKDGTSKSVVVKLEKVPTVAVLPTEKSQLSFKTEIAEEVQAPVEKGDVLGKVKVILNGQEIDQINYIAQESVPKKPPFWMAIINWFMSLFS
jgi:D-alanyl-D-alanine carboxypeptidase (penicillin-binding protein 5/6)